MQWRYQKHDNRCNEHQPRQHAHHLKVSDPGGGIDYESGGRGGDVDQQAEYHRELGHQDQGQDRIEEEGENKDALEWLDAKQHDQPKV
jgi:hypothetical protein